MSHCIDQDFAAALDAFAGTAGETLVIANGFTGRVLLRHSDSNWEEISVGDLGSGMKGALLQRLKKNDVRWQPTHEQDLIRVKPEWSTATPLKGAMLTSWQKRRDTLTKGRKGEVSRPTRLKVASLAANRCQFAGCGDDLRDHVSGAIGNFSYFAHIVASSPDGPRGDIAESTRLADSPDNIMLLCDKCHRLIDRVAPQDYPTTLLREMREANIAEITRLLDTLRFKAAQPIAVLGNIAGQTPRFDEESARRAMWGIRLRSANQRTEFFANIGGHLGASNSNSYWTSLFTLLKTDIPRLQAYLNGTGAGGERLPLAVFPLHGISILVLYGRLLGESSSIHQFQFHRDELGNQWRWPELPAPTATKFFMNTVREHHAGETDALLRIFLTAEPPASRLPPNLYADGEFQLPTIDITTPIPSNAVISHPQDLLHLGITFDEALRELQDKWHIQKIHTVIAAPATANMRFGQKLQARHHSAVILYESSPESATREFSPTISISSTAVTLLSTGESASLT